MNDLTQDAEILFIRKIVGIRFKPAGKIYDFESGAYVLNKGDYVITETEQGLTIGMVAIPPIVLEKIPEKPLKKIFRLATENDFSQQIQNAEIEHKAHEYCEDCIEQLNLEMNLFRVESTFDGSKLTFYFTAEGRVDFRDLVKMLVKEFHTRIEMRQVGVRHQAKMCGGIGRCGREICCSKFLNKFEPVSIRMAKDQNLSLNPTKISGLCGRLMCCLTYENEMYQELKKNLPRIGKTIRTTFGTGRVSRHNVICDRIGIVLDNNQEMEVSLDSIIEDDLTDSEL